MKHSSYPSKKTARGIFLSMNYKKLERDARKRFSVNSPKTKSNLVSALVGAHTLIIYRLLIHCLFMCYCLYKRYTFVIV